MNIIRRISIEKFKGKDTMTLSFSDLHANQPNILVAPNGFGKSTLALAFEASSSGRIKLKDKDRYQQDPANQPKLEIELMGENQGLFTATEESNTISQNISIYVINSPVYAKSTTRNIHMTPTAELSIEQVTLYTSIPDRVQINYSITAIRQEFGNKGKLFLNISELLQDAENLYNLSTIKNSIDKSINQIRIKASFASFLDSCDTVGNAIDIKHRIEEVAINSVLSNENVAALVNCIRCMNKLPEGWCDVDAIFTAVQICKTIENHYSNGERDIIKRALSYAEYKETRAKIDERLANFNTTGRTIRTREDHGKLVIDFTRADAMSNGERDVLSFIANLATFEQQFKRNIGILVLDEVFDYLDGCNMLAVQYYLSQTIKRCNDNGKVLFPLLFTHLDPEVFGNYYFKKKKVHYLSCAGNITVNSDLVKLLRYRERRTTPDIEKNNISKYFLHYHPDEFTLEETLRGSISSTLVGTSSHFREELFDEVISKYLLKRSYNPVAVIAAVRVKIEEKLYMQLSNPTDKIEFLETHKTINKLDYAEEKGVETSEVFYLLQPLYNDGLHLFGDDNEVSRRIKSTYLKVNNLHVLKLIEIVFNL